MKLVKEGVWQAPEGVVHFTAEDVAFLEREARHTEKRRARILAHPDQEARLHEMLIAFCKDSWNEAHAHEKVESMLVLHGMMTVNFPNDGPFSQRLIVLHAGEFLRIPPGVVHQPLPVTDCVVMETVEK